MYLTTFPYPFSIVLENKTRFYFSDLYIKPLNTMHPELIAASPILTIGYAFQYNTRFELGEQSLLKDAYYVYYYLALLRIPANKEQENVLITSANYSYRYAKDVLKGPFKLGEQIIATNPKYACAYAKYVLQSRFELGEEIIATDPKYASEYKKLLYALKFNDNFNHIYFTNLRQPNYSFDC